MADGIMAIYRGEHHVGDVRWTGTLGRGTWRFVARVTLPDAAQRALTNAIEQLPFQCTELRRLYFSGPRGTEQRGWTGFTGVWGALNMVLPTVGLRINPDVSRWVRGIGPAVPDDVLLPEVPGAAASDAAADQWEILALQARARERA